MSGLVLLEPFTRRWMESKLAAGGPAITDLSVEERRRLMRDNQGGPDAILALRRPRYLHEQHHVSGCPVHILKPMAAFPTPPVLLYLHGGGWALGDLTTHARLLGDLAVLSGSAVVFPEYRLSPETPFPGAVEECYKVANWIFKNAVVLGLDRRRIAIAGDSAGGNLAAVVAMLTAQRGGPQLLFQALLYPVTDYDLTTESYREFGAGFNLDASVMEWLWEHYVPEVGARRDPLASPLRASLGVLRGTPPALIITAECDVLRDEGEAYARKLAEAGVPTAAYRCLGTVHSFLLVNDLTESPPAKSALNMLVGHLRSAFESRA